MNTSQDISEPIDRKEVLDHAEAWMREGLRIVDPPGFFQSVQVDMSHCRAHVEKLRQNGIRATYTHIFVRATALALTRHPDLHQLVSGRHRLFPGRVDIGLSVAGTTVVAPVLVIEDAGRKSLKDISREIITYAEDAREKQAQMLEVVRKWGWIIPFGWMRRWYLRLLMNQIGFRRKGVGTFQVSCLPNVDQFVPFLFSTAAILGVGRVRDRVLAVNGQPTVQPSAILSCCVDHKIWDGIQAARFLAELDKILSSGELGLE